MTETTNALKALLCFWFFALLSLEVSGSCGFAPDPQAAYDDADAVALVRMIGGVDYDPDRTGGEFEVIRAWKSELPKRIRIPSQRGPRPSYVTYAGPYHFQYSGRYIVYLHRQSNGNFRTTTECSWNLHESERAFNYRLQELEKATECGCKGYDKQGFSQPYLYQRADIVVAATVIKEWEDGIATYVDIAAIRLRKPHGIVSWGTMLTIRTDGGGRPGCGYPIDMKWNPGVKSNFYGLEQDRPYFLFYLQHVRDEEGRYLPIYTTDICSGNLHESEKRAWVLPFAERTNK